MTAPLDSDIKAMRAITRALDELPDKKSEKRVLEYVIARRLNQSWYELPPVDRFPIVRSVTATG